MKRRASSGPGAARDPFAALSTETPHPRAAELERLGTAGVVALLLDEESRAVRAVSRQARAIVRAAALYAETLASPKGRVVYAGAGTSGRLGALDAVELPPTFGVDGARVLSILAGGPAALRRAVEGAEDRPERARLAVGRLHLCADDLLCAIAASGVTPFTRACLDAARAGGAKTIFVTCVKPELPVAELADVVVAVPVGPEVVAGSTRLKAGTATKLVLNAISTAAMIELGKTYRGRMVDLRATNAKLRARALRIVEELAGVDEARAQTLLDESDGQVRLALAAALLGSSVAKAREPLARASGQLARLSPQPAASRRARRR